MNFKISFTTTSLMVGFNLLWSWAPAFALSSRVILCMQRKGLIPLIMSYVHPFSFLFTFSIYSKVWSWFSVSSLEIITENVFFSYKSKYLRWGGEPWVQSLVPKKRKRFHHHASCQNQSLRRASQFSYRFITVSSTKS